MTDFVWVDKCPYCDSAVKLIDSSLIYGTSYGMAWACSRFPDCDSYVGCHKGPGNVPLGRLANKELRMAKMRAHQSFDPLWKGKEGEFRGPSKKMARRCAYFWLAGALGMKFGEVHIGEMDVGGCERVVKVIFDTHFKILS